MEDTDGSYRVIIEGPGVRIEREVTDDVGRQLVIAVMAGSESAVSIATTAAQPTTPGSVIAPIPMEGEGPALSLREFMDSVLPKRNPDKLTAIAVFLKRHRAMPTFMRADLTKGFEDAAEPMPGNLGRDVKWAVKNGWIAPSSEEQGSYYVTSAGEQAVEGRFPPDLLKKTGVERGKKRTNSGKKGE